MSKRVSFQIRKMGLIRYKHWLVWGPNGGKFTWLPYSVRRWMIKAWNRWACWKHGHPDALWFSEDPSPTCSHCGAALPKEHPHTFVDLDAAEEHDTLEVRQ